MSRKSLVNDRRSRACPQTHAVAARAIPATSQGTTTGLLGSRARSPLATLGAGVAGITKTSCPAPAHAVGPRHGSTAGSGRVAGLPAREAKAGGRIACHHTQLLGRTRSCSAAAAREEGSGQAVGAGPQERTWPGVGPNKVLSMLAAAQARVAVQSSAAKTA